MMAFMDSPISSRRSPVMLLCSRSHSAQLIFIYLMINHIFLMAPATLVVAMSGCSAMKNPHTAFRPSLQFMTKQTYRGVS